ncbi:hypothetical protein FD754_006310 [Muntiacus muntjak]|uniref:Fibrinogen C-terminal domain-containing protein n=1 Tax=Muntiacus muntjak TaxID=9888 RepID=A0A5N3WL23_MUNMU|nr:hypothetical protein FD754_006310 [Muntiacus muntjak]
MEEVLLRVLPPALHLSSGHQQVGPLQTPLSLFLLLFGEPACLRSQDHPSCPEPRKLEASKVVLLLSCPGAPGSPGEKGAPGSQVRDGEAAISMFWQPGPLGKMGPKGEPGEYSANLLWGQEASFNFVFCDKDTAGGGWLVKQSDVGSQESEFWRGTRICTSLLSRVPRSCGWSWRTLGNYTFVPCRSFLLLVEADHHYFQGRKPFPTDHDTSGRNCMVTVPGACWYGSCYQTNLNGRYSMFKAPAHNYGIDWASCQGVGHPYHRD